MLFIVWVWYEVLALNFYLCYLGSAYRQLSLLEEEVPGQFLGALFLIAIYGLILSQVWPIIVLYVYLKKEEV